jgi:PadR family transcriptional regulator, regulatory protein PadR
MRISFQTRLVLQAFLDAPAEELYGFALTQATGLKAGTLYPVLERLRARGWLSARWEEIDEHAEGRRRRRYYRLTDAGRQGAWAAVGTDSGALRTLMPGWGSV